MTESNPEQAEKKVKYIASIIYLLVFAFIVGGSYINQQQEPSVLIEKNEVVTIPEIN
ncbi:MAG: hypothetical protein KAH20_01700 [Methylococcales bacterium]|nr:hypothetical protein [Methylococcales bacterium]